MSRRKRPVLEFRRYLDLVHVELPKKGKIIVGNFTLSENNRVTRVYEQTETGRIISVICVSLDIYIKKKWKTIVYYDTAHGHLHRHERVSLNDDTDAITATGVRQKGTKRRLLRWAIEDVSKNYITYKKAFLERSGYTNLEVWDSLF